MREVSEANNLGNVVSVQGSVVDIRFEGPLPPIHTLLYAGKDNEIFIEVLAQLDAHRARGMSVPTYARRFSAAAAVLYADALARDPAGIRPEPAE